MFWSKSNSRSGANKVLWVFYDGEKDFPTGAVGKLKRQGVTVFSAGVGAPPYGWMNSAERENNVISFADDKYHYACAEDWMSIINNVTSNEKENIIDASDNERALYVPDDTYTKGKCSPCPRLQRCVCNVLNRRYTCAKYDVTPTQNTHREVNLLLIIIIVGSATAVLLILIVCCICCICCWRRRRTKHREDSRPPVAPRVPPRSTAADGAPPDDKAVYYNESVTPPEVTPRLAPRRAGRPTVSGDIPSTRVAYFNASQFVTSRPDVVPPQDANDQAADDEGCASVARSRDTRQTVDLNMSTDNGIGQDQDWLNQPVDRDPQNDVGANGIVKGNLSSKSSNSYNVSDKTS
ncbi:hypothetical protein LSAT2_029167 [Lamellibrachia satsuma]|nr:hypothetical protein LSAT2_029167 [Lamellibrachia satsuma]